MQAQMDKTSTQNISFMNRFNRNSIFFLYFIIINMLFQSYRLHLILVIYWSYYSDTDNVKNHSSYYFYK